MPLSSALCSFLGLSVFAASSAYSTPSLVAWVGGSDDCATPESISGAGPHAFDNSAASVTSDGQTTSNCAFFGQIGLGQDVWFVWTAGFTGTAVLDDCGLTTLDTKIAVYAVPIGGPYCPGSGAVALACNDDILLTAGPGNFQSRLSWNATSGNEYLIQVGLYPVGMPGGTGAFTLAIHAPATSCQRDDGSSENAFAAGFSGSPRVTGWLMRDGVAGASTNVSTVSVVWGFTSTGGVPLAPGLTGHVGVFDDPNDDGNPSDGVLLATASAPMVGQHTDAFQAIPLGSTVTAPGVFFLAAWVHHTSGFPAAVDIDGCGGDIAPLGWMVGHLGPTLDTANLANNSTPPFAAEATNGNLGLVFLLRGDCSSAVPIDPGVAYCAGDGSGTACPCANHSAAGAVEGCLSSLGTGARLRAQGSAHVATDSSGANRVVLGGTRMPNGPCLYFQGTQRQSGGLGVVFGDGLRCVGGSITRLATKTNVSGASQYPEAADAPISVRGGLTAPGVVFPATRTYQVWYRNAAAFCVPNLTFNLSNGHEIVWLP